MNRKEIIEYYKQEMANMEDWYNPSNSFGSPWSNVDVEKYKRYESIVVLLSDPTPDPITGLVPCGCGGKAGFHYSVMMRDNDCYVECGICGVHTKVVLSEDKARDAWNTAMGWKGGEK